MKSLKKISYILTVLTLGIWIISCEEQSKKENEEVREVPQPKQIITLDRAQGYYKNYSERRVPLIQKYEDSIAGIGMNNKMQQREMGQDTFYVARYVNYDLQTIKDYIAYIEQESKKVGAEIKTMRLYFANYPNEEGYVHPKQNSIFFVPAVELNNQEYGLYIREGKAAYLNGQLQPYSPGGNGEGKSKASMFSSPNFNSSTTMYQDQSLILNFGGSSPPPNN